MKHTLLIVAIFIVKISFAQTNYLIGQKSIKYVDQSRKRPLLTEIWYPTNLAPKRQIIKKNSKALFKPLNTTKDAPLAKGNFPLLLMSHGTGGNRFSLTWMIEKLVEQGYIVVSLDHYGNNTFHKLPREFVKWWERAIDIQFVLTQMLQDPTFGNQIDQKRIGGVGFSLGGYTNIALAGGYVDRAHHTGEKGREMPPEFPKTDEKIDFDTDTHIVNSYKKYKDKVKDERIKAFFVMAPAIGFGFHSPKQTKEITAPILIVAGRGDTNTPIKGNAQVYHRLISTSTLHLLGNKVNHYIFLNEATPFGKKVAPAITIDLPGVDRNAIHGQVSQMAIDFFAKHLK
ncbi:hypothetical protein BKI52_37110 [marine bacterium AO1-C]|nr:hypothetical protein BKI52_37110 [marine bacterium AO1-C]